MPYSRSILLTLILLPIGMIGQTLDDALRFSAADYAATAGHFSVGGGMSALGGDFGVISINPASLGVYRRSSFSMSPIAQNVAHRHTLVGAENNRPVDATKTQFGLANVGAVFQSDVFGRAFNTTAFAIGVSRRASFSETIEVSGGSRGSITDQFIERANGLAPNQLSDFNTGLAFDVGALYDLDGDFQYETDPFPFPEATIDKVQTIQRSGSVTDFIVGWGGNIRDKVHVGATIGLPIFSFQEERRYQETDTRDEVEIFEVFDYAEDLDITGIGFQTKIGVTYLPKNTIRIGAYVHTPVWMSLTDIYQTEMAYQFDEGTGRVRLSNESPESQFDYSYSTPWRFGGGVGWILGKSGFLSADVEHVNYASGSFNLTRDNPANQDLEDDLNREISARLQSTFNYRIGGEYSLSESFKARAGAALLGNPMETGGSTTNSYRLGLGYRKAAFFVDLAYAYTRQNSDYLPYTVENRALFDQPVARQRRDTHVYLLTGGVRF